MRKKSKGKAASTKAVQLANDSMNVGPLDDVAPVLEFLENFQKLMNPLSQASSQLISIKMPPALLAAFRYKAEREGVPYQTMIKRLMSDWLKKSI